MRSGCSWVLMQGILVIFIMKRILFIPLVIILVMSFLFLYAGREVDDVTYTGDNDAALTVSQKEEKVLPLREAVGQMLMVGFRGYQVDGEVALMLLDVQPGGFVLFDYDLASKGEEERNIESPEQVRGLTKELREALSIDPFIAVDAESGYVNRLKEKYGFSVVVLPAQELGTKPVSETVAIARDLAKELRDVGINWNFAPVVDVNVNPESPAVGGTERSFSSDPVAVAEHASAFIEGLSEFSIIPAIKHFPGHGSASGDTHLGVTDVTDSYEEDIELAPYRTLIAAGYDDPIMTAHIINRELDSDGVPGTLSSRIVTDLLREDIGFDGVIISDDMQMGAIVGGYGLTDAVVRSIQAGVDIVLLGNQIGVYDLDSVYQVRDAIVSAVEDGVISEERIYTSVDRILKLKRHYRIR